MARRRAPRPAPARTPTSRPRPGCSGWPTRRSANEPDAAYREELFAAVVACAKESLQRLRPGRMEVLRTRVPQVHYNRRPRLPDGSVRSNLLYPTDGAAELTFTATDDELVAVRFVWNDSGAAGAVLVNFACHPVTGDPSRRPPVASWSASGRAWRAGGSSGPRNDRAG